MGEFTNRMNMKIVLKFIAIVLLFSSCKEYDSYLDDYEYTSVYFAYQNPIRTVYADDLNLEVGVVMGGVRKNDTDREVTFTIEPELLDYDEIMDGNEFTLLPSNYYTLNTSETIIIPSGEFLGTVQVSLNKSLFLNDSLAIENTYALPFLITDTSLDSILTGTDGIPRKDYSIVVVKYRNVHHGIYYHRGVRFQYDDEDNPIDTLSYASNEPQEFVQNIVWEMATVDAHHLSTNGIAEFTGDNYSLEVTHAPTDLIAVSEGASSVITGIVDNGCSYDANDKTYFLNYEYTVGAIRNVMFDTLIFRDDDMRLELW